MAHHLTLASGQRAGSLSRPFGQLRKHRGDVLETLLEDRRLQEATHLEVLLHRQRREHVLGLGHITHSERNQFVSFTPRDVVAVESDATRAHLAQTEDSLQERGLAGAIRTDDAHELAGANLEIASIEDVDLGDVPGHQISRIEHQIAHASSSIRDRP